MELFVIFSPLVGAILAGFGWKIIGEKAALVSATFLLFLACFVSWFLFIGFDGDLRIIEISKWMSSGSLEAYWAIRFDRLTAIMLIVVTTVSALVHLYSFGYMDHDPNWEHDESYKPRFFAYLSFFTFAMLMLVTSDNLLQMFFGWEGVGVASYLLIGFYYKKPTANSAAIKAFVVNRVGDFGFALGIFGIFYLTGSIQFSDVFLLAPGLVDQEISFLWTEWNAANLIAFLLFVGAMGKSAQLFLHTWLPDAMEGPTPVSALIHAATMVTAGVFLVVRCSPIYEFSEISQSLIVVIGASTAFFAATIGLVQNDIKKIIAYSTCSQLGYMFFAAGIGAYHIAIFHLFTHAFFKALLFLCAGSVIHSLHEEQDIRKMGGIYKKIPVTYAFMLIGTLAITGFPFLSGFYSKDAILEAVYYSSNGMSDYATVLGVLTAVLTSIYSWRLIYKTFHGKYRNQECEFSKVHESPAVILFPLFILTLGAIFSGFLFKDIFIGANHEEFWKVSVFFKEEFVLKHPPLWFLLFTPITGIIIIFGCYYFYVKNEKILEELKETHQPFYNFLLNKWYFDELYDVLFVRSSKKIGLFLWKFFDLKIIDGFGPDGISAIIKRFSIKANKFQSGFIYQYAFVMLLGFSALLTFLIVK